MLYMKSVRGITLFGMVQNHERAPLQLNEQKEQFPAN
jgi:hypothetical protein